jgi:hypothetical protein
MMDKASAYDYRLLKLAMNFNPDPKVFFENGFGNYSEEFPIFDSLED